MTRLMYHFHPKGTKGTWRFECDIHAESIEMTLNVDYNPTEPFDIIEETYFDLNWVTYGRAELIPASFSTFPNILYILRHVNER